MKTVKTALALLFLLVAPTSSEELKSFRDVQWKYPRVRTASKEKDEVLRQRFKEKGLAYPPRAILLRAFKQEASLELWAADAEDKPFVLVHEYRICTSSGTLGPKRRFGDEQVPEGFYELDWFNPQSNFFLSLHISYPNASDRILGSHQNPGGDIFLHGNCASIGCIPITDDGIKEVYWLAVLVHSQGQKHLPIQIFPARLTDDRLKGLAATHRNQPALLAFWTNVKQGYDLFETSHQLATIKTRQDGAYEFIGEIASRHKR
jgi:murein L,D-transpeptidase YafK